MLQIALLLLGYALAPLTIFVAYRLALGSRREPGRPRPAPKAASAPASDMGWGRAQARRGAEPLSVALAQRSNDVDAFASQLMSKQPGLFVTRSGQEGWAYPCYVVAIPDEGLSMDLRPIAFDPRSEMAALESLILTTASENSNLAAAGSVRKKARRL